MIDFLTLKPEAFGLDISDLSLKIVKLKERRGKLSLVSFGEAEIKPGIVERGEIKDEKALAEVIKKAVSNIKGEALRTKYVVASLPEEKAFLQVIQMPLMKEEELRSAVHFEAENYIPLSIDEVYLDSQIVKPVFNNLDHSDILITAMPKNIINPYVSSMRIAGLIPTILEIEPQAIARALIKNQISPHPVLLIDFGATKTSFIIFAGFSLRFTSSISISSHKITEAIVRKLNVDLSAAEKIKKQQGIEKGKKEISEALLPILSNLADEIKKYLAFYHSHASHEHLTPDNNPQKVQKIIICGGGANLKGLVDFLSLRLRIPIELGNPWVNILPPFLKKLPSLPYEKSLAFTTALGLALRGIFKDKS